jgi:two-component system response regulator
MTASDGPPVTILLADDDEDDRLNTLHAFSKHPLANELRFAVDGEDLMNYLRREGPYSNAPRPGLILLDLNMPRKDGREALKEIKEDPELRNIPVVVLTTSGEEEDILRTYDLGANSFIRKPVEFDALVKIMDAIGRYWFQVVELPPSKGKH